MKEVAKISNYLIIFNYTELLVLQKAGLTLKMILKIKLSKIKVPKKKREIK